jgi:hypothetical protein
MRSLPRFCYNYLSSLLFEKYGKSENWIKKNKDKYKGQTCFIFGNGPSLKDFEFEQIKQFKTFGTNGIFLKYIPNFFVTISSEFYVNHINSIQNLNCERKFISNIIQKSFPMFQGSILNCNWPISGSLFGFHLPMPLRFSKNCDRVVFLGGSVLFVCLQLAYYMGFHRVILAGVDHRFGFDRSQAKYGGRRIFVSGADKIHFDPNYNPNGHSMHCDMLATERSFQLALDAFRNDNREIWNVTPHTGLDVIPCENLNNLI